MWADCRIVMLLVGRPRADHVAHFILAVVALTANGRTAPFRVGPGYCILES